MKLNMYEEKYIYCFIKYKLIFNINYKKIKPLHLYFENPQHGGPCCFLDRDNNM